MKVATIVGARPQFIKAAAFSRAAKGKLEEVVIHTGQHYDPNMSDIFFEQLKIPRPQYNLGINGGTHGEMTGAMLPAIEHILVNEKPEWVLVYGDTNSTMAGALAAVKVGIKIAHIESGVRLGTLSNPEEVNRIITDHISTLLFAPTQCEAENLYKENLRDNVNVVGNIMYDSYLYAAASASEMYPENIYDFQDKRVKIPQEYYYLTCHRQENTYDDRPLFEILSAANQLDAAAVYPVHPRNRERAQRLCKEYHFSNVILVQPVGYMESMSLLSKCKKVITDSGGLQCEAFFAGKQCITIFDRVVWPQTMVDYRNQLSQPDAAEILDKLSKEQKIDPFYQPYGNGHTAEAIVKILMK